MNRHEHHLGDDWESRVRHMARSLSYPPTPNVAASVVGQMATSRSQHHRLRWAGALLAIVLALALLLAVPEVRAALRDVLRLGGVRILLDESAVSPVPLLDADAGQTLSGETTLDAARAALDFPLRYPSALGEPDRVYLQQFNGPLVVLVWTAPGDPSQAAYALHILGPGVGASKGAPHTVEEVRVNGQPALWIEGPHMLVYQDIDAQGTPTAAPALRQLVEGHVLIWVERDVTYRLECDCALADAIALAEAMIG